MELELVPERYLLLLKRARIKLVANIAVMVLSFILLFVFSGFLSKLMCILFLISFATLLFTILSLYNTKDRLEHQKMFLKNDIFVYAYFNEISENNGKMNYYVLKKPVRCFCRPNRADIPFPPDVLTSTCILIIRRIWKKAGSPEIRRRN